MSELDTKQVWDALTYDQRLAATAEVFEAICEHAKSSGSFRYLIYNRLKFNHDAYSCLYAAGGMAISNMCNDCKELVDEPEESSTFLQPEPDSDSQPLADCDTSSNTLSNTTHLLRDIVKLPDTIQEIMRENDIVFDNTSDKMQMFALSLYTDIVQLHSKATEILEQDGWTTEAPTVEGWYWIDEGGRYCIVYVGQDPFEKGGYIAWNLGGKYVAVEAFKCEWQGPLKPSE